MLKEKRTGKNPTSQKNVMQQIKIRNLSFTPKDKYNVCYKSKLHALLH